MKQTATDYFYDRMLKLFMQYHEEDVPTINFGELITEAHEQAKVMEKEQMFAFTRHYHIIGEATNVFYKHEFEQYYNETYNQ
jgi:hypothetical protein